MKNKFIMAAAIAVCLAQPAFAAKEPKADQFAKIDTDGNGKISKEEWLAYSAKQFADMCKDGDEEITRSEWNEHR